MSMDGVHSKVQRMREIGAGEFKQRCLQLLDEVGVSGEPIIITKRGRPVAQLTSVGPERDDDRRGAMRDQTAILGDVVSPAVEPEEWEVLRD
jgi:prevent-host-death family protein